MPAPDGCARGEFKARIARVLIRPDLEGCTRNADIMAEYLACGFSQQEAAARMGIKMGYAYVLLGEIRKALGEQAI